LERNGDSTYSINNLRVRRRDVADLFLGTGVGARAYAIIEQGMIARLIEAKPEELRGYLEEAAGVSKYKERRKETEARLKDARDNLNRVDDIQRELKNQLEKLAAQAEVAQQYRDLNAELTLSQHRLWYAKKRDAKTQRDRVAGQLNDAQTRLEAETARLRQIEATLEAARQTHFAGQDALNVQQATYYQAQSEVARIEQSMQHQNATRKSRAAMRPSARIRSGVRSNRHCKLHCRKPSFPRAKRPTAIYRKKRKPCARPNSR